MGAFGPRKIWDFPVILHVVRPTYLSVKYIIFNINQQSNRDLAVIALEKLIVTSDNGSQIFTAIRCLLRIKLTIMDANPKNKL